MYLTPLFFPNLIKIQRESFLNFLQYGIKKEIIKFSSIINEKKNIHIFFYPKLYQLNLPNNNCQECIFYSKTYNSELIIPIKFYKLYRESIAWVKITNLPVLTNKCHFITNGCPRVIMNQITRSPGVYYHKEEHQTSIIHNKEINTIYYADIIAERGNWLRFEIGINGMIYMKIKKAPKLPALTFLQAIGIKLKTIIKFFKFPIIQELKNNSFFKSQKQAILKIKSLSQLESIKNNNGISINWIGNKITIFDKIMNSKYYELGKIGRMQINKKFNNFNSINIFILNSMDLLLIIDFLLKVKYKLEDIDDIDNLKNKRIKISGELLQIQFNIGIIRLQRFLKEKIFSKTQIWNINTLFSTTPITSTIAEFFGINPLSQFMDEINPLASITHKRRVSSLGLGGINRDTATLTIRSIHPTLYGRICPIETPEGKNAGLVNSFSLLADINGQFLLTTPVFKIYNRQILYQLGVNYISTNYEENNIIIPYDINKTRIGFLPKKKLPSRVKKQLKEVDSNEINFISISRIQMLSIATSLIPFLEHNDANRVLMGSNMQRQAVPLIKPECCLIGTGLESKIIFDLEEGIISYTSGLINSLSCNKIIIYNFINQYKTNTKNIINTNFIKYNYIVSKNFPLLKISNLIFNNFVKNFNLSFIKYRKSIKISEYSSLLKLQILNYSYKKYKNSNQGTCTINRLRVNEGQWIKKKDFFSNGFSTYRNELALGNNLFVAYISWKGYNFEDAVVINKNIVFNHLYTSTHLEKFDTEITRTKHNYEIVTCNIKGLTNYQKKNLDKFGIIKTGARVYSGDILVGKKVIIENFILSPYRKLLYDILKKQSDIYKDTSLRVPKYKRGRITLVSYLHENLKFPIKQVKNLIGIKIHLMQNKLIQIGDKISGRHGNKGVISNILIDTHMPYLIDGTCIDIILNPLGVPSRMNIGQVLECLLGLSSFYLHKRFKIIPFDEVFGFEISRNLIYSKLYCASLKTGNNWLLNEINPGKNKIIDSYSGFFFDQPITIGKAYILKLIHLVEEKIHARSTATYSLVTQQPLKGKSKRGGQRVGEMEVWALEGYGAAYTLHEILTVKSDDIKSRQKVLSSILNGDSIKFGSTETFKVLIRELQCLCLNLKFFR